MVDSRFLTLEEARLLGDAAERWLRLRDVEFNAGEYAAALLAAAQVRAEHCEREDIATLGRTLLLAVPGEADAIPITLVRPHGVARLVGFSGGAVASRDASQEASHADA